MTRRSFVPILLLGVARAAFAAPAPAPTPTLPETTVLTASDASPGDAFGRRVSVSGDTILVGANGDDERGTDAGAAYVFELNASGAWVQTQKLLPPQLLAGDFFGWSVAIDGDVLVVGAPGDDRDNNGAPRPDTADRGAAYAYRRVGGTWVQEARLQPAELAAGDAFGWSVALDMSLMLVSAPRKDAFGPSANGVIADAGDVWAFLYWSNAWQSDGRLNPNGFSYSGFGFSLALEGAVAVVGAPFAFSHYWPFPGFKPVGQARFFRLPTGWAPGWSSPISSDPDDGVGESARVNSSGIDTWADGSVVILDGQRIRKVSPDGRVTTLFSVSATPASVRDALEADPEGSVYIAARDSTPSGSRGLIVKRRADATETVLANALHSTSALVRNDVTGDLYFADGFAVRRVARDGQVSTVAGTPDAGGSRDGPAASARFMDIRALAVDATGGTLYVGEHNALRRITLETGRVDTLAGYPVSELVAMDVDLHGNVLMAVGYTDAPRLLSWDGSTVATIAGSGSRGLPVDGSGTGATVRATGMARFGDGDTALLDDNMVVRRLRGSTVTSLAGVPVRGYPVRGYSTDDELYGYDVAVRDTRMLVGTPRSDGLFTGTARAGYAWEYNWHSLLPVTLASTVPALPRDATPLARYGSGVAITRDNDMVLGPANGCLWISAGVCRDDSASTAERSRVMPIRIFREDTDRRWYQRAALPTDGVRPQSGYGTTLASDGKWLVAGAPEWDYRPQEPAQGDIVGPGRVFVYDLDTLDADGDTMPDAWERPFGLDPYDPGDASLDPDNDGRTNAEEYAAHTHPTTSRLAAQFFAEGATSSFFETEFSVANPGVAEAIVNLRFMTSGGALASAVVNVPARQSRKLRVSAVADMERAEFSTQVESDHSVVVDRLMWWDREHRYGSHGERRAADELPVMVPQARSTWYFAEGATHSGFELFYLLQNPSGGDATVNVTYLRPDGPPLVKIYLVPARSRYTIWVNQEEFPAGSGNRTLASAEVSAIVETPRFGPDGLPLPVWAPVVVERAMYRTRPGANPTAPGTAFEAGHASAGIPNASASWFFAEGATGDLFDLFFLVANPFDTPATLLATYLLHDGTTLSKTYTAAANSRTTIWVNLERFPGIAGTPLASVSAVSTTFEVQGPHPGVIVERAMWWPREGPSAWTEAHASAGATTTAVRWVAAAGAVTDAPRTDTYYLIANPADTKATVQVTLLFADGTPAVTRTFDVAAHSRFSVDVRTQFPEAIGRGFGALIESVEPVPVPIVVEWAVYNDAMGIFWAAGANALATPVP